MLVSEEETSVGGEKVSFSQCARAQSDTVESFPGALRSRNLPKMEIKGAEKPKGSSLRLKVFASLLANSTERLRVSRQGKGGIVRRMPQTMDSASQSIRIGSQLRRPGTQRADKRRDVQFPLYLIPTFKARLVKVGATC